MSIKISTGFANYVAAIGSWSGALKNGIVNVYSGTQPTSANDASTGTLLCQFSTNGGTYVASTRAAAKLVIAGGSGSVDTIKVAGISLLSAAVPYNGSLAQTLADVISNINSNFDNHGFYAVTGGGAIGSVTYGAANAGEFYIVAPKNSGTTWNALTMTTTSTTLTIALNGDASPGTSESGGFAAVSGDSVSGFTAGTAGTTLLSMTHPASVGLISKSGTWSDSSANASGTATWFRYLCTPEFDDGTTALSTTGNNAFNVLRLDGSVGTSGSDMIISNASITAAASQTINQFDLTIA